MNETELRAALDDHLDRMTDVPPVAWENTGDLDQDDQIYLSTMLMPAEDITVGIELGGSDVLAGIYQIMINIPKGTGKEDHVVELERLRARFPRSLVLNEGTTRIVIHKVWANNAIVDDNYFRVPVSIRYRAMTA